MREYYKKVDNETINELMTSLEENEKAIKLYENMNFKIINIRKKYYNDIDAYVMERN